MMAVVLRRFCRIASIAVITVTWVVPEAAWARRVGFVNAAKDGAAGLGTIEAQRRAVVAALGPDEVAPGPGRDALEAPLTGGDDGAAVLGRAQSLVTTAKDAFKVLEYDGALDRLRQADSALRGLYPTPEVVALLADVNLLFGQIWLARKDETRALESFRVVHRLAPERQSLDEKLFRPQVLKAYAQAEVQAQGKAAAVVTSEPPGAMIWVNGRVAGTTPLELSALPPGDHYLAASLDGHVTRSERLTLADGERREQAFLLARLPAEQRARAIRAGLVRGSSDFDRAAADLADVASVDVLVVVREQGAGFEWAAYDLRTGKLGAWVDVSRGVPALVETVPRPTEERKIAVPKPDEVASKVPVGPGGPGGLIFPVAEPKWYRTWWGTSLLIGGGLAAVGAILWATAPQSSDWPVDTCWNGSCP
jgi:hypothetical protein